MTFWEEVDHALFHPVKKEKKFLLNRLDEIQNVCLEYYIYISVDIKHTIERYRKTL